MLVKCNFPPIEMKLVENVFFYTLATAEPNPD